MAPSDEVTAAKAALRRQALETRDTLFRKNPDAGQALSDRFAEAFDLSPGAAISGYWPMGSEIDVRPLLHAMHAAGRVVALPVVEGVGRPLTFRQWQPGDPLVSARFGTHEPAPSAPAVTPGVMVLPMLAFDLRGMRLGYGGGFYDRTLAAYRSAGTVRAIGAAFAGQQTDHVPNDRFDQRLDAILTEQGRLPLEIPA